MRVMTDAEARRPEQAHHIADGLTGRSGAAAGAS